MLAAQPRLARRATWAPAEGQAAHGCCTRCACCACDLLTDLIVTTSTRRFVNSAPQSSCSCRKVGSMPADRPQCSMQRDKSANRLQAPPPTLLAQLPEPAVYRGSVGDGSVVESDNLMGGRLNRGGCRQTRGVARVPGVQVSVEFFIRMAGRCNAREQSVLLGSARQPKSSRSRLAAHSN